MRKEQNKSHIMSRLLELHAAALKKGAELDAEPDDFIDDDHLDCIWYGEGIASIKYKDLTIYIGVYGDVHVEGFYNGQEIYYKNKSNSGAVGTDLYYQIPDDDTLDRLLRADCEKETEDHLEYSDNNWVEVLWDDGSNSIVANSTDVLEAIGEAIDAIEDIYMDHITHASKAYGVTSAWRTYRNA